MLERSFLVCNHCTVVSTRNSPVLVNIIMMILQVIPNYSSKRDYDKMSALGVSMYGQMTAGSYCYIGPQGIVHGTTVRGGGGGREEKALKCTNISTCTFLYFKFVCEVFYECMYIFNVIAYALVIAHVFIFYIIS